MVAAVAPAVVVGEVKMPRANRLKLIGTFAFVTAFVAIATMVGVAQRGGGGGGGGGSAVASGAPPVRENRLDTLTMSFKLTNEQKDATKSLLDAAHKSAAPLREGLRTTRTAISAAIVARKPQPEIDAAIAAYAEKATAMTAFEMKTLADLMRTLTPEQRQNSAASQQTFFMFRGIFLDERRWNVAAEGFYGY